MPSSRKKPRKKNPRKKTSSSEARKAPVSKKTASKKPAAKVGKPARKKSPSKVNKQPRKRAAKKAGKSDPKQHQAKSRPNQKRSLLITGFAAFAALFTCSVIVALIVVSRNEKTATIDERGEPAQSSGAQIVAPKVAGDLRFTFGGPPANLTGDELLVLTNQAYLVGYSEKHRCPRWVAYRFDKAPLKEDYNRTSRFPVDERTVSRVEHADYTHSGYDRGHMAPAYGIAECYGDEAMNETFLMSNIVPQRPTLNRVVWRELEAKIAREYADEFGTVWIVTGPVFDSDIQKLESGVEIPDAFFKIVVDETQDGFRLLGFLIPQEVDPATPLDGYLASIDEIELQTGLDFFGIFPDEFENEVEAIRTSRVW